MTDVRTRRLTVGDATALAAIDASCFDVGWDAGSIGALLSGELTVGWAREVGGVLAASVLIRVVAGEGEVLRLAVLPAYRRLGHARALVAEAIASVGPLLTHGLHLEVRASNHAACELYGSLGFLEVGRRTGYYVAPVEDAVLMRWAGAPPRHNRVCRGCAPRQGTPRKVAR